MAYPPTYVRCRPNSASGKVGGKLRFYSQNLDIPSKMVMINLICNLFLKFMRLISRFQALTIATGLVALLRARSALRPGRLKKLNLAEILRSNPGFEYLLFWWGDDPAKADSH
ncbi:hypothetical protein [Nostoc sp.]|uniref:hypothetical protein n=1 Tax=Nostoc sp. TaxID=1180 RepID=UPI002FF7BF72